MASIKKNVIIGIIVLIVSIIVLVLFNPFFRGYLESQNELKESHLIQRYEKVVSSLSFNLPDTSDQEKYLNMPNFLTQFGTCYYDAYASMMNYVENTSYDEFIWYGRPLMFQYYDSDFGVRLGPLRGELGWQAFHNLGYTRYCGNTKGKFAPASNMSYISPDKNYVFFKSGKEALEFIKKLMSAEHPIYIQIKDWAKIPHFQTIFGYNETHIISPGIARTPKINWLEKPLPEYYEQPLNDEYRENLTYKEFLEVWSPYGHEFCWLDKTGSSLSKKEIWELNKKDALEAPENIQMIIDGQNKLSYQGEISDIHENGVISVAAASRYLKQQGYNQLADKYMEIATAFYANEGLSNIQKLYTEAANFWENIDYINK